MGRMSLPGCSTFHPGGVNAVAPRAGGLRRRYPLRSSSRFPAPTTCSMQLDPNRSPLRSKSSSQDQGHMTDRSGHWQRSCSPTSLTQLQQLHDSATRSGGDSWSSIIRWCALRSDGFALWTLATTTK